MRFLSPYSSEKETFVLLTRKAGYMRIEDRRRGAESFVRTIHGTRFPRFHIYLEEREDHTFIDLHLDQKQPSYFENHAHNAEYDGPVVVAEKERIMQIGVSGTNTSGQRTAPSVSSSSLIKRLFGKKES